VVLSAQANVAKARITAALEVKAIFLVIIKIPSLVKL
jgi:hypothetical protein